MNATQTEWFLARNKKQFGPLTLEQIWSGLASGRVLATDLLWNQEMASWQAAYTIPELGVVQSIPNAGNRKRTMDLNRGIINGNMKNLENEKNIKNINDDGVLSQFKIFHNSLSSPMKFLIYGGSGILILCFLIGIAIEDENEQDIQESSENVQIKREYQGIKIFDTKIDMYKFAQVKTGMTVDQVNSIAKKKGNLFGESEAFGKNVQMYSWENKDGSNMTLTFENGRVISKAQIGLQ